MISPPVTARLPAAWIASSPVFRVIVPPEMVTVPAESVSSSSGSALTPSFSAVMQSVPLLISTEPSEARPLFAAVRLSVMPPSTVMEAVLPPLIAFLQAEPSAFKTPVPVMVRLAPALALIAAPSKASAIVSSVLSSLAGFSASVRVFVPVTTRVTPVSLLQLRGAEVVLRSVRSLRISVTPVVPFLTVIVPSEQLPVTV